MLYGMCINGFEAWTFQNAYLCHGNRKNTQFAKENIFEFKFHPIPSTLNVSVFYSFHGNGGHFENSQSSLNIYS
jgi:hypothetical protein